MQSLFQMVDITLSSPLFNFEIIWSGSGFYFVFLESTSCICVLNSPFDVNEATETLHSVMILLHQWVNYNSK